MAEPFSSGENVHLGASNFTIRNGYLVQGGYGYLMYGMFAEFLNGGITVDNVSFTMQGMNATAVDAANARGNVTVTNSLIHSNMDAIDNRYLLYSFISMPGFDSGYSGNVDIERNTLSGTGQVGIQVSGATGTGKTVTISGNDIRMDALQTNCYASVW